MVDNVHSPSHYQQGYIESIYAIHQVLGDDGFHAFCMGNYLKYQMRHAHKGGQEDLEKAQVYLQWATNGLPKPINGKLPEPPQQCHFEPNTNTEARLKKVLTGVIETKTTWKVAELAIEDHESSFEVVIQLTLFKGLYFIKSNRIRFPKAMKYADMADVLLYDIRANVSKETMDV